MTENKERSERNILKAYNMMIYFAGTMIMWDPSNECIYDFWTKGMIKSLPVSSNNPRFIKAAGQLHTSVEDKTTTPDSMKADFQRLFSGSENSLAPPFESVYMNGIDLINGSRTNEVGEFYRAYGWKSKFNERFPDDHLGIELLFLTLMIEKYLELDDEACHVEMRGEIKRFIGQHIITWIPKWNEDLQNNADTLSYKGIGTLINACIEDIYEIMDRAD